MALPPRLVEAAAHGRREDVASFLGTPVPPEWPQEDLAGALHGLARAPTGWGLWLVVDDGTGALVGDVGFHGPPDGEGVVEVGYATLPAARDRRVATRAVAALVDWALAQGGARRVVAHTDPGNEASARLLLRLGFGPVGDGWERRA